MKVLPLFISYLSKI